MPFPSADADFPLPDAGDHRAFPLGVLFGESDERLGKRLLHSIPSAGRLVRSRFAPLFGAVVRRVERSLRLGLDRSRRLPSSARVRLLGGDRDVPLLALQLPDRRPLELVAFRLLRDVHPRRVPATFAGDRRSALPTRRRRPRPAIRSPDADAFPDSAYRGLRRRRTSDDGVLEVGRLPLPRYSREGIAFRRSRTQMRLGLRRQKTPRVLGERSALHRPSVSDRFRRRAFARFPTLADVRANRRTRRDASGGSLFGRGPYVAGRHGRFLRRRPSGMVVPRALPYVEAADFLENRDDLRDFRRSAGNLALLPRGSALESQ